MLSKKDLEAIRKIIREELKDALVRTVTVERGPETQGDPEKVIKEEEWNVLDFMAAYLPKVEGSVRGMQEDVDKTKNQVHHMAGIMVGLEKPIMAIGEAAQTAIENKAKQVAIENGAGDVSIPE